jgi:predicted Zn-dependent peptidase
MLTIDEILERARKYTSYTEFREKEQTAYQALKKLGAFEQVKALFGIVSPAKPYTQMSDEELIEIARKYKTRGEMEKSVPSIIAQAYLRSITEQVFSHCVKEKTKSDKTDWSKRR